MVSGDGARAPPAVFALAINAELPAKWVPLFSGLGLLSYPLYAVQLPILKLVYFNLPWDIGAFVAPAAALIVAAVVARALEIPRTARARPSRSERPASVGA